MLTEINWALKIVPCVYQAFLCLPISKDSVYQFHSEDKGYCAKLSVNQAHSVNEGKFDRATINGAHLVTKGSLQICSVN